MVNEVIELLKQGKVGIIPTETVLGLCTTFDNQLGLAKIYELKQRDKNKRLSIIVENFAQIEKNFDIELPKEFKRLAFNFWPGPLTIILEDKKGVTWGFRKPQNEIALYILSKLDKPLACTSVNLSNKKPEILIAKISKSFTNNVDFIINSDAQGLNSSTVYDLKNNKILREGPIKMDQILSVLND